MFQAKLMQRGDFGFATRLANTMDWGMATEDFEFACFLEPRGCFVLYDGPNKVGIATCVSYGLMGWFGNLIVEEDCRKKGGGSFLVNHSLKYFHGVGVRTVGLYAYPHLVAFYESLGFRKDANFMVLHSDSLGSINSEELPSIGRQQFDAINKFDRICFGGDRRRLLESIFFESGTHSFFVSEAQNIVGFVGSTNYESSSWVGPLICENSRPDIAVSLVRAVLAKLGGKSVYAVVPTKDSCLLDTFLNFGFEEVFLVSRMFLGKDLSGSCIHLPESLERG
jgi:GNAT superfamily N-acetyltransferase